MPNKNFMHTNLGVDKFNLKRNKKTREKIKVSTIAVIHYVLNGNLFEASVIDSKYNKMKGLQDFY